MSAQSYAAFRVEHLKGLVFQQYLRLFKAEIIRKINSKEEFNLPTKIEERMPCRHQRSKWLQTGSCSVVEMRWMLPLPQVKIGVCTHVLITPCCCGHFGGLMSLPFSLLKQIDRRNDDWVNLEQLRTESTAPVVDNLGDTQTRSGVITRRQKRQMGTMEDYHDDESLREHEAETKVKKINKIRLGNYEIETWYYTPLPPEYDDCEELFFCEFCLTFLKRETQLQRHMKKECNHIFPNGKEIYTSGQLSVLEVDGTMQRVYAENLCYLAKMFLDHKSLWYEVQGFLFYILCEKDDWGFHIRGYFSKEKDSERSNILACILTLPPYQKRGYGNFLIAFCKYATRGLQRNSCLNSNEAKPLAKYFLPLFLL